MKKPANEFPSSTFGALLTIAALMSILGGTACPTHAQTQYPAPSWTGGDAYQSILNYNNYFYSGQASTANSTLTLYSGESGYSDSTGDGQNFGVIYDTNQTTSAPYWHTFWTEAEQIEVIEDAYWWAANTGGNPAKYLTEVDNLVQGFIDEQYPTSNFCNKQPPWSSGDPYCWHGSGFTDIVYDHPTGAGNGNGGDWFNDDLMWASMALARAWRITYNANKTAPVSGWLTAAREQVDFVWANAQAQTNADGTEVGLLQAFCNTNKPQDGVQVNGVWTAYPGKTCVQSYGVQYTSWRPNLDAEVNFTFVIAAKMIADDLTLEGDSKDAATYKSEAAAVWAWTKENLVTTNTSYASTCSQAMTNLYNSNTTFQGLSNDQICAEVYDANSTGTIGGQSVGFDGENNYWNWLSASAPALSNWDFSMNYGTAIQAAIRMGDKTTAQEVANYLMFGLSNPNHGYAGNYEYGNTGVPYYILPNYGTEGANYDGSNGIAFRGLAYGLFQSDLVSGSSQQYLDKLTLNWAQANLQAAWNDKNSNNVMWNDWTPGDITDANGSYTYNSWDCSDAVAGILTIGAAATPPGREIDRTGIDQLPQP